MKIAQRLGIIKLTLLCLESFLVQSAVIYDSFIPDNSSCTETRGFGCLCDKSRDCNIEKHLECIDYKCFCIYPLHRLWNDKLKKCVSLVGSVCEVGLPRCIRGAECEDGRCACTPGYTVTSKLTCMIGHGQECGPFQCNIEEGLACKSGVCDCLDSSYIYSAVTRRCFDPEKFLKNLLTTWFDRTFIRGMVLHTIGKVFRRVVAILKSPIRLFRFFG